MEGADFGGYATRTDLECSDGRTIKPDAFKHMDGKRVPLLWKHDHKDAGQVLGHGVLEAKSDGVYVWGFFNNTKQGKNAKELVHHKDITALSIWANKLRERAGNVFHGTIREVSLVLAGANPGAFIDFVNLRHEDGSVEQLDDEVIIHTGDGAIDFVHSDEELEGDEGEALEHQTVEEVYNSLTDEQKQLFQYVAAKALEAKNAAEHSDDDKSDEDENKDEESDEDKEGSDEMTHRNVFDRTDDGKGTKPERHVLSHEDKKGIFKQAIKLGSMKAAVEDYALAHGIENIDVLFPDARSMTDRPEFDKRRTEWVAGVINGTRHSPFSRVKSITADLTEDDARAKGYIKGNLKKEEFFSVSKRVTTPTTVYKKQKLDRDDILDITDFDIVAWLKFEMRIMLEEEVARAILIGDGRATDDEDKIKDPAGSTEGSGIRSILNDHELYATTVNVNISDANSSYNEIVETVLLNRRFWKGTGSPTFYTTADTLVRMLLAKDTTGRRLYANKQELAAALMVADIVEVEVMESVANLIGIIVNLSDYNVGADRGGEITMFDDFDIDYNQYKYLIETRVSGALIRLRSALVIKKVSGSAALVYPITAPTFNETTGVVTIPTQTGVTYKNKDTSATLSAGAQSALDPGDTLNVIAVPASSSYYFETNAEDEWSFTRPAS